MITAITPPKSAPRLKPSASKYHTPAASDLRFQPHQHSRTRFLLEDFAASFAAADLTIVPDIYFVRDSEAERHSVSSGDLVERIKQNNHAALHLPEFKEIVDYLRNNLAAGDLVVTMGAGNVWEIGRELISD